MNCQKTRIHWRQFLYVDYFTMYTTPMLSHHSFTFVARARGAIIRTTEHTSHAHAWDQADVLRNVIERFNTVGARGLVDVTDALQR